MFLDEKRYSYSHLIVGAEVDKHVHSVATQYSEMRAKLVQRFRDLATRFKQSRRTQHVGIEMMDRFFLDPRTQSDPSFRLMKSKTVNTVMITCFLVASKLEELDDRLVFIDDVQTYYSKESRYPYLAPTWTEIVENERMLMHFFDWDLGFLLPIHYLEIFLANGVLFESEHRRDIRKSPGVAGRIAKKSYELLEEMLGYSICFKNNKHQPNQIASTVIYMAREEVLGLTRSRHVWPKELQLVTRISNRTLKKLVQEYKQGVDAQLKLEPFEDQSLNPKSE
jgi:hypothetical protein